MASRSIFEFDDYRTFLVTHYEREKERWADFSYNIWARKLDLKNNTSIIKIIKGQRNAGPEMVEKLSTYFGFSEREKEYFEGLVRLEKLKDDSKLKVMVLQDLQKLNYKNKVVFIDEKRFSSISSVWYFTLRQMAKMEVLTDDFEGLRKSLRKNINLRKLKQVFTNLLDLGLIVKDEKGYRCLSNSSRTSEDVASEAIKLYHEETLDLAKESIRSVDLSERNVSAVTLCFAQDEMDEAKKMIREFQDQFAARFGTGESATHVYQLQTQFFPLTFKLQESGEHDEVTILH